MFEYAIRKKYLTENPLDKVQILVKFKQVSERQARQKLIILMN